MLTCLWSLVKVFVWVKLADHYADDMSLVCSSAEGKYKTTNKDISRVSQAIKLGPSFVREGTVYKIGEF